ncbi:unnamed protein product [Merluccius merluccius]
MSTTNNRAALPPSVLGLDTGGPCHQRAVQKSRSLARAYLLSCSVPPACGPAALPRNPVRLPSLTAAQRPHRQTPVVSLSFSEPSLSSPGENVFLCGNRHRPSSVRKRLPPSHQPPSRSSSLTSGNALDTWRKRHSVATPPLPCQNKNYHRPIYTHFSQPIRPSPKVPPSRSLSDSMTRTSPETRSELRPSVMPYGRSSCDGEALSVIGRPCLPGCCQTPALVAVSLPPKRTQLHVFLPTGDRAGEEDGEEADSESVDEGFMDELDSKITALRLQRPKAVPDH